MNLHFCVWAALFLQLLGLLAGDANASLLLPNKQLQVRRSLSKSSHLVSVPPANSHIENAKSGAFIARAGEPAKPEYVHNAVENSTPSSQTINSHTPHQPAGNLAASLARDEAMRSLISSFLMILVSEVGDKTFLIAAIFAMSRSRILVFSAALSALAIMSVLSAVLGNLLPSLISKTYTQLLAGAIFLVMGFRMWHEARGMSKSARAGDDLDDVAAEIRTMEKKDDDAELGHGQPTGAYVSGASALQQWPWIRKPLKALQECALRMFSSIFIEIFVLTFLAEWGDRSQISTIVMGAAGHTLSVILGTVLGHIVCTGIAVVGGRMLAAYISVRTMTSIGAVAFVIFGIITLIHLE